MENDYPLWYKLIIYWCRQRVPRGYGLTLPFIIGVLDSMTISKLLHEIKDSQYKEKIILRMCYDLNEYVLSTDEKEHPIAQYLTGEKSLLYNDNKIESFKSLDEVIAYLESKYSNFIDNKTYSKNILTQSWEAYTPSDSDTIEKAKSI